MTALDAPAAADNPRRLGVLHVIHTMAYGGVETAVLNWIRHFDREHFDVHLACFANPGQTEAPFIEAAARHGIHVELLPWHRGKPVWRVPSNSPGPRNARSCSAILNPSFVSRIAASRLRACSERGP